MEDKKNTIAKHFIDAIPHAKALGLEFLSLGDGVAEMKMPYRDEIVGDPKTGVIHGGAVSALLDTCCGAAVMSHPDTPNVTATIDLRIDYMRPATPHQAIVTRAEVYKTTRSVAFVRATAYDDDSARPVAMATGAFVSGGQ